VKTLDRRVAGRIRLLVLDADGVLTDGGIYVSDGAGEGDAGQLRRFDVKDGLAVYMLREAGIEPTIVSGRDSPALRARARELGIEEVHQVPPWKKVTVVERMQEERGIAWEETACLADDLADLAVLERAGIPGAVADAVPEVRERASWQGTVPGGQGAVREFAEALLRSRGEWARLVERYVEAARRGTAPGGRDP